MAPGTLTFFTGKMGAGKSTLAAQIARQQQAVLLSEDEWLSALYPGQITSVKDYITYAERLKSQMQPLVQAMLAAGTSVVMDFPANTTAQRAWFKAIFTAVAAPHRLVFIDVSDALCLQQIEKRRLAEPHRAATDTPEMFARISAYFQPPAAAEGFNVETPATLTSP
ncbi:AAA family ATPase [Gallaecimonas sp. GXIMD1310]|uniref:AAA family ATPase n=1 Tax=Gallaecimonas sp. GXIMD1310 TaxID=3131926 RepID=UPI0032552373